MKLPTDRRIQAPQLPRHLPSETVGKLESRRDYDCLALNGSDFCDQEATLLLFEQVRFRRVAFTGSRLEKTRWVDTRAERCDLSGAVWEKARFRRAEFIGCRLLGIQLLEAQLEDVLFRDCDFENAILAAAVFKAVRLERCTLRGVSFCEADLRGTVFHRCDLTNSDMQNAKLQGADLRGSILNGMRAAAKGLQQVTIDPTQALQVVTLLGMRVQEDEEPQ